MKISKIFVFVMLSAIAGIMFLVGCGRSYEENQAISRAERDSLRRIDSAAFKVGVMPTLDCLPVYMAQEKNLFDTLGVAVHLKYFTAQMDCDTALVGGSVQGSITDQVRAKRLISQGTQLTMPITTNTYWLLLTSKQARLKRVDQMGDKIVGMARYSASDMLTDEALKGQTLKSQLYRVQVNDVKVRLQMLLSNQIDGAWLTEPQASQARLRGAETLWDSRDHNISWGVFAFRAKDLKNAKRQKQMKLFVEAYNQMCDSLNSRGLQHYSAIIKKYYKLDDKEVRALPKLHFTKVGKR